MLGLGWDDVLGFVMLVIEMIEIAGEAVADESEGLDRDPLKLAEPGWAVFSCSDPPNSRPLGRVQSQALV